MSIAGQNIRDRFRKAVDDAGGISKVAEAADVPRSHLSAICNGGRPLARETAIKLRPHLTLDAETWLRMVAPVSTDEPSVEASA